ncbi:hypothetical protein GGX14DRAFT_395953 [Mycena pura]|uniref:Uncharacterized protein n=1 Tax=Mycena pura TaxID=153505 RepID=A0AAD6YE36_9AGAR|nr:hypothetical protein GGX14DRAFT_395953 [Mycena pura]
MFQSASNTPASPGGNIARTHSFADASTFEFSFVSFETTASSPTKQSRDAIAAQDKRYRHFLAADSSSATTRDDLPPEIPEHGSTGQVLRLSSNDHGLCVPLDETLARGAGAAQSLPALGFGVPCGSRAPTLRDPYAYGSRAVRRLQLLSDTADGLAAMPSGVLAPRMVVPTRSSRFTFVAPPTQRVDTPDDMSLLSLKAIAFAAALELERLAHLPHASSRCAVPDLENVPPPNVVPSLHNPHLHTQLLATSNYRSVEDPGSYANAVPVIQRTVRQLVMQFPQFSADAVTPIAFFHSPQGSLDNFVCLYPACDRRVEASRRAAQAHVRDHHWPLAQNGQPKTSARLICPACPAPLSKGRGQNGIKAGSMGRHLLERHIGDRPVASIGCKRCDERLPDVVAFQAHFAECFLGDSLEVEEPPQKRARWAD